MSTNDSNEETTTATGTCPMCKRSRAWAGRQHRCPPSWKAAEASVADDEAERFTVYATDSAEAAEEFAKLWWDGESPNDGETLDVVLFYDDERSTMTVTASWSIDFHARGASS